MEPRPEFNSTVGSFPFTEQDWDQTPPAVPAYVSTLPDEMSQLHEQVARLQARLTQDSTTSSRPPSSDSPDKRPRRRTGSTGSRKGGGKPGHPGHRQVLLAPTSVKDVLPESCACGSGKFDLIQPYYTHQVIELPRIEMEVTHWVLHQGRCMACGGWQKAPAPSDPVTGYGPRFSALMAELAGTYGNGRRMVQTFCSSVLGVPISLGAIQKVLDRVTHAIDPHYLWRLANKMTWACKQRHFSTHIPCEQNRPWARNPCKSARIDCNGLANSVTDP
jgi:transposase